MFESLLTSCQLCPRKCGVNRISSELGYCGRDARLMAARAALHFWEEPCLSGTSGSGAVFFSGCPLRCIYCQNHNIANASTGKEISIQRLADIFLELEEKGALNINLVTPTHYVPHIIAALDISKSNGLSLPVIYNCSGYELVETLQMLEGYIDIYLPDFKYITSGTALRYSNAKDYPDIVKTAIAEMMRQVGPLSCNADGIATRGTLVRHLVLPEHIAESKKIIQYLFNSYGNDIFMSIMNQYTPTLSVKNVPPLNRKVTSTEYEEVLDFAISLGVENAFIQEEGTADESFIPEFNMEGI